MAMRMSAPAAGSGIARRERWTKTGRGSPTQCTWTGAIRSSSCVGNADGLPARVNQLAGALPRAVVQNPWPVVVMAAVRVVKGAPCNTKPLIDWVPAAPMA